MTLRFSAAVLAEIVAHSREQAPIEVCGYLAEKDGLVIQALRLTNADASPDHFSLLPKEQFEAVRSMRRSGVSLRAVYHSHPSGPARMSEEDIRLAADRSLSYVVVSLAGPEPVVKSFTVGDTVQEEPLDIDPGQERP